jgi:DNA-binding IclR family transcriptional regulator
LSSGLQAQYRAVRELSDQLKIPKSTVYSLEAGACVVRLESGSNLLGPRLLRLAQAVGHGVDLISLAKQQIMDELARKQGATVKLSVLDAGTALVVGAVIAPATFSVSTQA